MASRLLIVGVDTPAVYLKEGNDAMSADKLGVLRAMRLAVEASLPGDLIVQGDMQLVDELEDDWPVKAGHITIFDTPVSDSHICPRSFTIPDEETRLRLIELWSGENVRACNSWEEIPKLQGPPSYYHPNRPYSPPRSQRMIPIGVYHD